MRKILPGYGRGMAWENGPGLCGLPRMLYKRSSQNTTSRRFVNKGKKKGGLNP
jgi:hypothetical protein